MNARALSQAQSSPTRLFTPVPVNLVQRKCACGGSTGLSGECSKCQKKKLVGDSVPLIQPKLKVSQPNDKYEQEADRVADEVMRMPEPRVQWQMGVEEEEEDETIQTKPLARKITPLVQRQAADEEEDGEELQFKGLANNETVQRQVEDEEEDEKKTIQTKGTTSKNNPTISRDVQLGIESLKGTCGKLLPQNVRSFMEPRFGHDFTHVRVHTDSQISNTAKNLQARAFTLGSHIAFGVHQFAPETTSGLLLLAHELAHTLQQNKTDKTIQRRKLTSQERQSDSGPLKRAKRRTEKLEKWLRDIEAADTVRNNVTNRARAKWVILLHNAKEDGFDLDQDFGSDVRQHVTQLRPDVNLSQITPPAVNKRIAQDKKGEDSDDRSSSETKEDGQEKKRQESESTKTESEELKENLDFPSFECAPDPITFDKLNKMPGTSGRNFGLTVFKKAPTKFGSSFDKSKKLCAIKIKKEGVFNLDPFVFVKPGNYRYAADTVTDLQCPGKKLNLHVKITPDMSDKIKQGEIEHCEDYKRAFALSTARFNKAMKDVKADRKFSAKNPKSCMNKVKERLFSKLGKSITLINAIRKCLRKKSLERDTKGWHNVNVLATSDKVVDQKCTKITYELDPIHKDMLPELGKHSAKDLVKGCGE
ncbi:MAG: DUF4157 domain-containing protein [Gammaproteobacteria bacterium]|nr:DUF4157 domain-containing protein [Gammaproteobacteria bacterium]